MDSAEYIQNWERLFVCLSRSRGHGRRWKFLIEPLKMKAKERLQNCVMY